MKEMISFGIKTVLSDYYIHKLVVKNGYTGQGNAEKMIKWIEKYSKEYKKEKSRLDCYADREYLLKLYTSCGFSLLKINVMPDGTRIALFEKQL